MAKYSPSGFIVVLPQTIIEIPQDSNLSWLTLFYALPQELVEKRADYLNYLTKAYETAFGSPSEKIVLLKNHVQVSQANILEIKPLTCW